MKPRLSSAVRAQTQNLLCARLEAVPSAASRKEAPAKPEPKAAEFFAANQSPDRTEREPAHQAPAEESAAGLSPVLVLRKALQNWISSNLQVFAAVSRWLLSLRKTNGNGKRLYVSETISLGEKRFVAVLHVDGEQFLIGGGGDNLSLLASLQNPGAQSGFSLAIKQAEQDRESIR